MIAVIRHGHRFGEPLRFVVNTARSDRVYVAPVVFRLRMNQRIAVAFRRRRQNERRLLRLREPERVMRPERAHFQRRDRQLQVIDRAGRRREMENVIDLVLDQDVTRDVVLDESEILVPAQVRDVRRVPRDEVIDRNDSMTLGEQPVRQMRAEEPRSTRDHRNFLRAHAPLFLIRARNCGEQIRSFRDRERNLLFLAPNRDQLIAGLALDRRKSGALQILHQFLGRGAFADLRDALERQNATMVFENFPAGVRAQIHAVDVKLPARSQHPKGFLDVRVAIPLSQVGKDNRAINHVDRFTGDRLQVVAGQLNEFDVAEISQILGREL